MAPLSGLERDALSVKKDDLVDLQRITLKQTSISWNDITKLHTDDVSWHKDSRFLLTPPAISENLYHNKTKVSTLDLQVTTACDQTAKILSVLYLGLGGEAGHESGGGIAGIVLLNETDCGVDDEQSDDPHKVLPVRRLPLQT